MLFKTRGIVFNYIKYRDSSIIVKIYTESFGLQSYIVNSVRSKGPKTKIALYQPLTLLDMVVYHKDSVPIHRISEIKIHTPLHSIHVDFKKTCIGIFLTEVLLKAIKEESSNLEMFDFLFRSIVDFDRLTSHFENFHLQFLVFLTKYLGFEPISGEALLEELFQKNHIDEQMADWLNKILKSSYLDVLPLNNVARRESLAVILKFYKLHVENFNELKSLEVLKDLMA